VTSYQIQNEEHIFGEICEAKMMKHKHLVTFLIKHMVYNNYFINIVTLLCSTEFLNPLNLTHPICWRVGFLVPLFKGDLILED
jgi:hypothetical protein